MLIGRPAPCGGARTASTRSVPTLLLLLLLWWRQWTDASYHPVIPTTVYQPLVWDLRGRVLAGRGRDTTVSEIIPKLLSLVLRREQAGETDGKQKGADVNVKPPGEGQVVAVQAASGLLAGASPILLLLLLLLEGQWTDAIDQA